MSRWGLAARLATVIVTAMAASATATVGALAVSKPTIALSTDTIVPGQMFLVTGSGWPPDTALNAVICGADAVGGTSDCANTGATEIVSGLGGEIGTYMRGAIPPKPCPCVVWITGVDTSYTHKFPVTVVGATSAPVVPPVFPTYEPDIQIRDLEVVGGTTLASSLGGAAPRTLELLVHNAGSLPETPLLLGRWGSGTKVTNVIKMPVMPALGADRSAEVRARFSLTDFSMGRYTVRVEIEVVGFSRVVSASTSTSTWPIALFVLGLVFLELIVLAITKAVRVRRRRAAREDSVPVPEELSGDGAGKQPEHENALIALGTQIRQSGGGTADRPEEPYDPNDPMWQLE